MASVEMEYVYLVYQEKSFSKAAQKLFVSQSAVSAMVRKTEAKIGCQIFDRSTIPLTVTKEGEYYIKCAEQFMRLEKNMDAYFKDMADLNTGHLSVGSSSFFYDYEQIILAVPAEFEVNKKLRSFQMAFAQARDGAFRGKDVQPVPMQAFRDCPFIFLKEENDICMRSRGICRNAGFEPKVELFLDQIMTSFYVAKSGSGIAFIRNSLLSLVSDTDALIYYKIGDPLARREIFMTRKKGRYMTKAMEAFLRLCHIRPEKPIE